jgi:hypothetical protein
MNFRRHLEYYALLICDRIAANFSAIKSKIEGEKSLGVGCIWYQNDRHDVYFSTLQTLLGYIKHNPCCQR